MKLQSELFRCDLAMLSSSFGDQWSVFSWPEQRLKALPLELTACEPLGGIDCLPWTLPKCVVWRSVHRIFTQHHESTWEESTKRTVYQEFQIKSKLRRHHGLKGLEQVGEGAWGRLPLPMGTAAQLLRVLPMSCLTCSFPASGWRWDGATHTWCGGCRGRGGHMA